VKFDCFVVRYSEIGLKGRGTRLMMENLLIKSIQTALYKANLKGKVRKSHSRIVIEEGSEKLINELRFVPGIASYSPCLKKEFNNVYDGVEKFVKENKPKSFRISSQRINKNLSKTSMGYNRELGERVVEDFGLKVKLKNSDLNVGVEFVDAAYVFTKKYSGLGGLPQNRRNKFSALIDSKKSLVAALLLIKRGLFPTFYCVKKESCDKLDNFLFYDYNIVSIDDWVNVEGNVICVGWGLEKLNRINALKERCCLVLTPVVNSDATFINNYKTFLNK
jgi:adenylyl- and sulfurtransferase ThiI